jgi:uncharacterized protein YndB with AHSA1/START domain
MENKEFIIERVFDAPREKVWQAWTDPEMLKRWWGPKGFTAPVIEVSFKVGGKYLFCMRGVVTPGGEDKDFWSTGTYLEIVPMERIVVTDSFADEKGNIVSASHYGMDSDWPLELQVEAAFEDAPDDKTKFTLRYPDMSNAKEKDTGDMRDGWNQSLDKLKEVLK